MNYYDFRRPSKVQLQLDLNPAPNLKKNVPVGNMHDLKPIHLAEIYPADDQLFVNRILNLIIIEDPLISSPPLPMWLLKMRMEM